jgi:hypothetical protein
MRTVAKGKKRLALLCAIFLALFSTGLLIAQQCHSEASSQVTVQHDHLDHHASHTTASKIVNDSFSPNQLIDTGCAALFIVVLLLGRKFLNARAPRARFNHFVKLIRGSVSIYRPQVFHLALTRPQLGVIRI